MVLIFALAILLQSCSPIYSAEQALTCEISLPQDVLWSTQCYRERGLDLISKRFTYGLREGTVDLPYNRLNMTVPEFKRFLFTQPSLVVHAKLWRDQLNFVRGRQTMYEAEHVFVSQTMKLEELPPLRKYFTDYLWSPKNLMKKFMEIPSHHEPFYSNASEWFTDILFAEQRLAGTNPMTIQRVTFSSKVGMHFDSLQKLLNPKFDLISAVYKVLDCVTDESSLKKAIEEGFLYVLYHPFSTEFKTMPDYTDDDPRRKMWNHLSPIAIFVSSKNNEDNEPRLRPIAIQMDAKKDSKVYTPEDGDNWMLAKYNTQLTDLGSSQMVEHLNKVHFVVEALCLAVIRQLSVFHPLHDFMRFHCLGIFTTNTLAAPELLDYGKALHEIFGYGNEGAVELTKRTAAVLNWHDLDLESNVKRRGLDDINRLPYYPYRDDGTVILGAIRDMVKEYVNAFYKTNLEVRRDEELQKFAEEISAEGNAYGKLRGFPSRIINKNTLVDTFARMVWIASAQHSAVGYPVAEYATYIPNVSTKLYDVAGVPSDTFNGARLNNRKTAALQLSFFFKIGTFRFDRLFDYASKLKDNKAKEIVEKHKGKLDGEIQQLLEKRNEERLQQGHLTYPYLLPKWLPNGVQE